MSSNSHQVIIKLVDQASAGLKSIEKSTQGLLESIERNREGIQTIGIASGVAFAGLGFVVNKATDESVRLENAMTGLQSIVEGTGKDWNKAQKALEDFTNDGLVTTAEASTSLKNLLARGFSLEESITLMDRFKNSATYNRQASLGLGEAVKTATEGIKNENSILVDNAGVTKNVSVMWKEYAKTIGKSVSELTLAEKRRAEYNGIIEETKFQMGDAEKATKSYSGAVARNEAQMKKMWATIGKNLQPVMRQMQETITPIIAGITEWAEKNPELSVNLLIIGTVVTGLVAGLSALALVLPSLIAGFSVLGGIVGALMSPITLVIAGVAALYLAWKTNFLGIGDIINNMAGWIMDRMMEMWGYIQGIWDKYGSDIVATASSIWENVKQIYGVFFDFIKNLVSTVLAGIVEFWKNHGDTVMFVINAMWEYVKTLVSVAIEAIAIAVQTGLDIISGIVQVFSGIFTGDWNKVWSGVKTIFYGVWNGIKNLVKTVLGGIRTFVKNVFGEEFVKVWDGVWGSVWNTIQNIWGSIVSFIEDSVKSVVAFIENLIGKIQAVWDKAKSVANWAGNAGGNAVDGWNNYWKGVGHGVSELVHGARASGGPVEAGKTYLVGEEGPELFTAPSNGNIIPNHKLGDTGSNTININMGGVVVQNEADENRLVDKIKEVMYDEYKYAKLGF